MIGFTLKSVQPLLKNRNVKLTISDQAGTNRSMNRRNARLLTTLVLLGSAQMHRCPGLEYSARAGILGKPVCSEAGVDETDEAYTTMRLL
jgi:hypothetical protein